MTENKKKLPLVITTEGEIFVQEPENKTDFTLKELQEIVKGMIQIIYLPNNMIMGLNEEGKLEGLELNRIATLYASNSLFEGDYIVGNVLLCEEKYLK